VLQTPFPKSYINNLFSKMQFDCKGHRFMTKFTTAMNRE